MTISLFAIAALSLADMITGEDGDALTHLHASVLIVYPYFEQCCCSRCDPSSESDGVVQDDCCSLIAMFVRECEDSTAFDAVVRQASNCDAAESHLPLVRWVSKLLSHVVWNLSMHSPCCVCYGAGMFK
jgi:hypothetical protein